MPKKQLFYLALIILMAALIWFLSSDKKSTISVENNFAISDTSYTINYIVQSATPIGFT